MAAHRLDDPNTAPNGGPAFVRLQPPPPDSDLQEWLPRVSGWLAEMGLGTREANQLGEMVLARVYADPEAVDKNRQACLRRATTEVGSAYFVERAWTGDPEAIGHLVDLWQADVLRWARWMAPAGIPPEEVAHDALVVLLTKLDGLNDPMRFRPWLWGVTRHTANARRRRAWFRKWAPMPAREVASQTPDAQQNLEQNERKDQVQQVLEKLNDENRRLLWLSYVEKMTRREIANLLAIPEGTLNRKLTKARAAFERAARQIGLGPEREDRV